MGLRLFLWELLPDPSYCPVVVLMDGDERLALPLNDDAVTPDGDAERYARGDRSTIYTRRIMPPRPPRHT